MHSQILMSSEGEEEEPCDEEAPCNRRLVSTVPCTVSSSACSVSIAAAALRIPKSQQIVTALKCDLVGHHGTEKTLVVCELSWYRKDPNGLNCRRRSAHPPKSAFRHLMNSRADSQKVTC